MGEVVAVGDCSFARFLRYEKECDLTFVLRITFELQGREGETVLKIFG